MTGNPDLDRRVRDIVAHAYKNTPAMQARLDGVGITPKDVKGADDLAKIPLITKDDVVRLQAETPPFGGMLAVPIPQLTWVFFSPGPIYEGVTDIDALIESGAKVFSGLGFGHDDIVLNAMSYALVPTGILLDSIVRKLGGTVLPTGVGNSDLQVKVMLDLGATAFFGTPSFLVSLIRKAEEQGLDFRRRSKLNKAMLSAEPLTPSLRETIKSYGIRPINLYGTAELGMLGFECEHENGFHMVETTYLQICDPQTGQPVPTGEIGEIVATNFDESYPLIRFGTGDLSIINDQPCACGRSASRLMGWLGRSGEAVKVRGMFLHPNQLRQVMSRFPQVGRYQAVITRQDVRDDFRLVVELADPNVDQGQFVQALASAVPDVCRVSADGIEVVPSGTLPEDTRPIVDQRTWE